MEVSLPAFAQRVTVFGSTRNIVATSAGVSSGSASGVRALMTESPYQGVAMAVSTRDVMVHFSVACPIWLGRAIFPVRRTSPSRTEIGPLAGKVGACRDVAAQVRRRSGAGQL